MNKKIIKEALRIFKEEERTKWFNLIKPLIKSSNHAKRTSQIGGITFALLPEEISMNYKWKFKIGDIVTDGKDIMKIVQLPALHPNIILPEDKKQYLYLYMQTSGNTYSIIRLDENGEDKEKDDPIAYLHQEFNENEIWLVE